jgi:threonine synthase
MRFSSTRDKNTSVSFREALFTGLAPDGGLYHPIDKADIRGLLASFSKNTGFIEMASAVTARLFSEEVPARDAETICGTAFPFEPKLRPIDEHISILELFHGPSCAFKDFGASFLATVMEYFLERSERRAIILTATSGDTGSAVAQAFHNKENIEVVILYPSGRVSPLQEKQLTTVGGNVTALEVNGAFDDCQRMVKEAFVDPVLRRELTLTSANSINAGRLLPQTFYYMHAYIRERERGDTIVFSVPSGNFGNLTAGVLAWDWGMGADRFIAATNINDVVPEYLKTGTFSPRPSVQTFSNAMDVGNPSNFERLLAIFSGSHEQASSIIHQEVVTDSETLETIRTVYNNKHHFLDPHTAVGYLASRRYLETAEGDKPRIISLSTAHPGKFLEIVEEAVGKRPDLPPQLTEALRKKKSAIPIENSMKALSDFLLDRFL